MESQILDLLLGGGGGIAVAALLFWLYTRERARSESVTDRYIAFLEAEAADIDEDERPTRPVRMPANVTR